MITVISSKSVYAAKRLAREAQILNCELGIMDLKDLIASNFKLHVNQGDVLYIRNPYFRGKPDYLPKIIKLARNFMVAGGRVVDANIAEGDLGLGKWRDYQKLKRERSPVPRTDLGLRFKNLNYPFVAKWIYGLKAKGVFLIRSKKDIKKIPSSISKKELMIQQYVDADYEYKVIVVGFKALTPILKFKIKDSGFRIDFQSHEVIKAGSIPRIVSIAEKASKTLGRELAKVDILDKGGRFYILEVNRFPGLKSFEQLTKYNVCKDFVKYLQKLMNLVY